MIYLHKVLDPAMTWFLEETEKEKKIHNCSECDEFPCTSSATYADSAPHNTKIINLYMIKKHGLATWTKEYSEDIQDRYFRGEFPLES